MPSPSLTIPASPPVTSSLQFLNPSYVWWTLSMGVQGREATLQGCTTSSWPDFLSAQSLAFYQSAEMLLHRPQQRREEGAREG